MVEHLPPTDPSYDDPALEKIFASQAEKDLNISEAREALRMRRIDIAAAQTPEEKALCQKNFEAAEAFLARMMRGTIIASSMTEPWKQAPDK